MEGAVTGPLVLQTSAKFPESFEAFLGHLSIGILADLLQVRNTGGIAAGREDTGEVDFFVPSAGFERAVELAANLGHA